MSKQTSSLRIGTRRSPLALAQAGQVRDRLVKAWPELAGRIELVEFVTSGDKFLAAPLAEIGGKGLFTKEIEEALLAGDIDLAVHSLKDMPTVLPQGLMLGAVPQREDARDVLISRSHARSLTELPQGCRLGTSSLRRAVLVRHARPDIEIVPLRGNVQTRLSKLEAGEMEATLLAVAGLKRLGIEQGAPLSMEECLPAVAQGALALECRAGDAVVMELLAPLNHVDTAAAVACERAMLAGLDGSCRTPIAGYARLSGGVLTLRGFAASADGRLTALHMIQGKIPDAERLGKEMADALRVKLAAL